MRSLKQAGSRAASQRGGDVRSNLRISSSAIPCGPHPAGRSRPSSISLETDGGRKAALPWLASDGWVITGTVPVRSTSPTAPTPRPCNARNWTPLPHAVTLDTDALARAAASPRSANMVLLGAAAPMLGISGPSAAAGIRDIFCTQGSERVVEMNLAASPRRLRSDLKTDETMKIPFLTDPGLRSALERARFPSAGHRARPRSASRATSPA
ncbi:MAG: 2-oxoacid:acceptor oxidoreductase family protein [Alistipes shahii]|uniref:2-oxoacid:acceptor oxidoreductase family protein n=1 Tax=Alistipes shahii TaxID=328814 RepID=UPI00399CBF49